MKRKTRSTKFHEITLTTFRAGSCNFVARVYPRLVAPVAALCNLRDLWTVIYRFASGARGSRPSSPSLELVGYGKRLPAGVLHPAKHLVHKARRDDS
jgi:hypothetical protein